MSNDTTVSNIDHAEASTKSLTIVAFDRIRSDILLARLKPLERLRITGLAERYGVGATAIREALSRLVADDLVISEDQRGFCVSPVSKNELLDLTKTRIDIETLALSRAIELGDVEWESNVISAFHRLSRCTLPTDNGGELHLQWGLAHKTFHASLVSGCKSPWLLRITDLLYDKSERYRNLAEFSPDSGTRDPASEHKALMDAVLNRDLARSTQLISEHFWATANIMLSAGVDTPRALRSPKKTTPA